MEKVQFRSGSQIRRTDETTLSCTYMHMDPFKSAAGCFLLITALFVSREALPGTP